MAKIRISNLKILVFLSAVLLGISGWLWWTQIMTNPDRVFSDAINKTMQTNSVTRKVVQGSADEGVVQTSRLSFYSPEVSAQTVTELSQKGENDKVTRVKTETIGTTKNDFVRYVSLSGGEGIEGAENFNKVIGQWAKRDANNQTGETLAFLNESLFGIFPFGNLKPAARDQLQNLIDEKDIYKVLGEPSRAKENGRQVYVYNVSVKPADLVEMIGKYMQFTRTGDPSSLNPADYANSPALTLHVTVDVASRNIIKVAYAGSERTETYSGYDLYKPFSLPAGTIPFEELQKRLGGESDA